MRRAHYDLYYVDNRSWLLDARTLGRTFGVVLVRARRPRYFTPSKPKTGVTAGESPPASPSVEGVSR